MSRRKQQKPRHLEEDEELDTILENGKLEFEAVCVTFVTSFQVFCSEEASLTGRDMGVQAVAVHRHSAFTRRAKHGS